MAAQPGEGEDELSRLEEAADKAGAEYDGLYDKWSSLKGEVWELERLKESKQDEEKKELEGQLKKASARKDLAKAKMEKAYYLRQLREKEKERAQLVIKSGDTSKVDSKIRNCNSKIKRWNENVVEWEEKIKQRQQLLLEIEQDQVFQVTKIEGYTCVRRSVLCLVYLPDTVPPINVDIQSVSDNTVYPKTSANEILLTPVVSITSQSQTVAMDKPVVIEIMKTVEVNDVGDNKIVPMFSDTDDSIPPNWEDLHEECEVLDDRFRFKTTHFTYFAVIARFSPPSASVMVYPETDFVGELTVRELPGFSVTIPPKSVQSPIEAKATLYYDATDEWKGSANEQLASACVRLEPEGQMFSEKISVTLPIPEYSEIIATNPGAKLQLMYRPNGSSNNWEIQEDMEIVELEGEFLARFLTDHFSDWKVNWPETVRGVGKAIGSIFKRVKSLRCRCQVFMSRETEVGSIVNFGIQVSVYPFQDPPYEIPSSYHCILHDSGRSAIEFTGDLYFSMELKEFLYSEKEKPRRFQKHYRLPEDSTVQAHFDIHLDKKSKSQLVEGAVIAHLSVTDSVNEHEWNLIKPCQREESAVQESPSSCSSLQTVHLQLPSLTATTRLDEGSLNEIKTCLWRARFKWRHIGDSLKIDPSTLEVIGYENRRVDDCFVAVLLKWLRSGKPVPCWKVLAEALSSPPVGVIVEETSKDETKSKDDSTAHLNEDENEGDKGSSDDSSHVQTSETTYQDITCEQTMLLASPLTVAEEEVEETNKGYNGTEDSAGLSDSELVNIEDDKENVTKVPPTNVRRISPSWFLSLLPVGGLVAVGIIWYLKRSGK